MMYGCRQRNCRYEFEGPSELEFWDHHEEKHEGKDRIMRLA